MVLSSTRSQTHGNSPAGPAHLPLGTGVDYPAMRLFIGIPLSAKVGSELNAAVGRIKTHFHDWRWSRPEGWHITLQFLGNTTPDQLQQLVPQLHAIQSAPVPVQLGGLDLFDRAGVFFVDVIVSPPLLALQQKVVRSTIPCGFALEARPYHPHITLA